MDSELKGLYDDYYGSSRLAAWRRLGAMDKAANVVTLCEGVPHDEVLDIGCGDGAVLQRLSDIGFGIRYAGLDISVSGVEIARQRNIVGVREIRTFDGYHIPYGDKQFDVAILTHVVEHVEHPRLLLYEAGRVARHVFVEVPLEHTLRLSQDYVPHPVGHINFYSTKTIRRLIQSSGFEVLRQRLVDSSKELFVFRHPNTGWIRYVLRRAAFTAAPSVAQLVFTYHSALLCRRP